MFKLVYLVLEVRNWSRHLKVFFQSTFHSCQKADSNPNMAQGHERNERRLVLSPQYEIDPGILRLVDQPLSFPARCNSIAVLHLGCCELKYIILVGKLFGSGLKYSIARTDTANSIMSTSSMYNERCL